MNLRFIISFGLYLILLSQQIVRVSAIDPYSVLGIGQSATDWQVENQYKKLRSRHRRNRARKHMVKKAYTQIMIQRKFQENSNKGTVADAPVTKHIDEAYVYGYKLGDQFDDGRYFKKHFNQTQHIIERMQNSESNKKTASIIVFFGSLIIKLLPCIIIFCLCRNRNGRESGLSEALARAGAGYAGVGRRGRRP